MAVGSLLWGSLTIPPAKSLNGTASKAAERQIETAGARSIVPLIYGEDRIGWRVLNVIKAADNTDALIQGLWGFAGDSVNDLLLNDLALPSGATVTHYTGSQTTVDTLLAAAFTAQGITYTDTLAGYMYSVLRLPSSLFTGALKVTARIKGRKLYDPRLDSTAGGSGSHRLATPSTWAWSDCPALALADWLYNSVYGAGRTVQWASVATVAAANDATIGSPAQKRRLIGISFLQQSGLQEMADTLRAYAGCFVLPEQAGLRLVPDADASTAATYSHAAGQIARMDPLSLRDLGNSPTAVEVFFTNTSSVPWFDDSATASLPGAGSTLPWRLSQVRLPGIQRYAQALREATERLNKLTLQDLTTSVEVFDVGIKHQLADIVEITHPLGVTNKKFRVLGVDLVGLGRWRLQLLEHDPASYSDEVETQPTYTNSGAVISEAGDGGAGISSYMIEIYTQQETLPDAPYGGSYTFVGDVFVPPGFVDGDPHWSQVIGLLPFNGNNNNVATSGLTFSNTGTTISSASKWGSGSLSVNGTSPGGGGANSLQVTDASNTAGWGLTGVEMTIEAWVYLNSAVETSYAPVIRINDDLGRTEITLGLDVDQYPLAFVQTSDGGFSTITGTTTCPPAAWFHLAITWHEGVYRLFLNGAAMGSVASTYINRPTGNKAVRIGSVGGFAMDAKIDDLRITKYARYADPFTAPIREHPQGPYVESIWSRDQPTGSSIPTWATRLLAQTTTPAVTIDLGYWQTPNKHVVDGSGGSNGVIVFAYQRSTSGAPALPSAASTYTFATGVLTGLNNGWTATIPTGTGPLYVTGATARSEGATDTIAAAEWADAQLLAASGLNNASVLLFRRTTTSTPPALPSAAVTYTFATGVASGLTESWAQSLPTTGGGYRWVTNATALGAGTTDTIATDEWSAAALLSQDGEITHTMTLSTYAVFLTANSLGEVVLPQSQPVSIVVRYGNTDTTSSWTPYVLAKSDTSITTSITGSTVYITDTGVESGWVDIAADVAGPGIDDLGPLRVVVNKQRLGTLGPLAMPGTFAASATATAPTDAVAIVEFKRNGEVWTGAGTTALAANWFAPSGSTVGDDYDVRFDQISTGGASGGLSGTTLATWTQIDATRSLTLTTDEASATTRARTFTYSIRRRSDGVQVSTGTIVMTAEVT